jgi:hypothetical protein
MKVYSDLIDRTFGPRNSTLVLESPIAKCASGYSYGCMIQIGFDNHYLLVDFIRQSQEEDIRSPIPTGIFMEDFVENVLDFAKNVLK